MRVVISCVVLFTLSAWMTTGALILGGCALFLTRLINSKVRLYAKQRLVEEERLSQKALDDITGYRTLRILDASAARNQTHRECHRKFREKRMLGEKWRNASHPVLSGAATLLLVTVLIVYVLPLPF